MVGVFDQNNDGFVDVDELTRVFARLKIDVSQDQIEELLADIVICGQVNVIALIESMQVRRYGDLDTDVQLIVDQVGDLLMGNDVAYTIKQFEEFDENKDGKIQPSEFVSVMRKLYLQSSLPPLTDDQLGKVTGALDANNSGSIDYMEFVDVFHQQVSNMDRLLEQICRVFYKHQDSLYRAFQFMDANGDGVLSPEEFADGLMTFNALVSEPLSANTMDAVVKYIDRNSDGQISYQEFCSAFYFVDQTTELTESLKDRHRRRFSQTPDVPQVIQARQASKNFASHDFPEQFRPESDPSTPTLG
eukprot:TRINITY_DN14371_c0_g1_i1.p1 TRINITY_DN14371_c0_g1~~TRINITY_DN14371_c0_g1_i1.p1  ORF type:complete len:303 (-),score=125.14 TRINITY_DN14371_c0_g1_i1:323-1231(-)